MRPRRGDRPHQRGAEPLAAVAPHRPLSPDHRQPRADRLRGRVRQPARPQHPLSRHPDALVVGRRGDRLHLRRDQLEGDGGRRDRRRRSTARSKARSPRRRCRRPAPTPWSGRTAPMPISSRRWPCPTAPADDSTLSLWPERPASPTGSAPPATAPSRPPRPTQRSRAALYRALGQAYDFALRRRGRARRLCRVARRCRHQGPGARADDADRQARLRRPLRQDPAHRIRRGSVLGEARGRRRRRARRADRSASTAASRAIVAAERAARRPAPKPDRWAELRAALHAARPLARVEIEVAGEDEFVLLVARREAGGLAIVAPVADRKLVDQAIRKSAA